jgi:hypothetical protein
MIVRLKKRGTLNPHGKSGLIPPAKGGGWHGKTIEVDPETNFSSWCDEPVLFRVIDTRLLPYEGCRAYVCIHHLIDDINAFDSDFCDEEAKEGDLAFAQIPAVVR